MLANLLFNNVAQFVNVRSGTVRDSIGECHYTLGCCSDQVDQKPQQTRSQDFCYHSELARLAPTEKPWERD